MSERELNWYGGFCWLQPHCHLYMSSMHTDLTVFQETDESVSTMGVWTFRLALNQDVMSIYAELHFSIVLCMLRCWRVRTLVS